MPLKVYQLLILLYMAEGNQLIIVFFRVYYTYLCDNIYDIKINKHYYD